MFTEYLAFLENPDARYAIRENTWIFDDFPFLLEDCDFLWPFVSRAQATSNRYRGLWFGPPSYVTGLHADLVDIILAQIRGSKLFIFFSPEQTPFLYEEDVTRTYDPQIERRLGRDALSVLRHEVKWSRVDPFRPDYKRFPLLDNAMYCATILMPGQAMYIPRGWWHTVQSIDVSISVSLELSDASPLLRQR